MCCRRAAGAAAGTSVPGGRYRPHVIVLRATGDVFCAGAHLGEMKELGEADYQENLGAALDMGAMFRAVRNCPVPVVARIQGPAYGGGVGLVAACDLAVAAPEARFAFTEVRLGIVPGVIAPLVIDRIGQRAARTCFLTAEPIGAEEALQMGLIDRLAADSDGLDDAVNTVVQSLLKGGPQALGPVQEPAGRSSRLGFARSAELSARMIAEARTKPEGAGRPGRPFSPRSPRPGSVRTLEPAVIRRTPPEPDEEDHVESRSDSAAHQPGPGGQPRRDRRPGDPRLPGNGHRDGGRLLRGRSRGATRAGRRPGRDHRPCRSRPSRTCARTGSWRRPRPPMPTPSIPATASWPRTPPLPGPAPSMVSASSVPVPR